MYLTEYIKDEKKKKENISKHLRNLSDLLKEVIEEIDCIEGNLYVDDEDYEDEVEKDSNKHGHWVLLDNCSNHGVYCSVCNKKVYKDYYGNVKVTSKYCPNCGAIMDGELKKL